jgi:hypothetical protein
MVYERFKPPAVDVVDTPSPRSPQPLLGSMWRVASVPVLVAVCFWLYGNAMGSVGDLLFPYVKLLPKRPWLWRIAVANLSLPVGLAGAVLFAYPIARIYGKYSVHVALLIFLPLVALRVERQLSAPPSGINALVLSWEVCTVALPLIAAVFLARRRILALQRVRDGDRSNPSIERTVSSGLRPLPTAAHVKR